VDLTIAGLLDRQGLFLLSCAFFFFTAQASMALSATERLRHVRAQAGAHNVAVCVSAHNVAVCVSAHNVAVCVSAHSVAVCVSAPTWQCA
jgi:hypothetical protein